MTMTAIALEAVWRLESMQYRKTTSNHDALWSA